MSLAYPAQVVHETLSNVAIHAPNSPAFLRLVRARILWLGTYCSRRSQDPEQERMMQESSVMATRDRNGAKRRFTRPALSNEAGAGIPEERNSRPARRKAISNHPLLNPQRSSPVRLPLRSTTPSPIRIIKRWSRALILSQTPPSASLPSSAPKKSTHRNLNNHPRPLSLPNLKRRRSHERRHERNIEAHPTARSRANRAPIRSLRERCSGEVR